MKQETFLSQLPPRTRATDPQSSHRAEQQVRSSGVLRGQAKTVLNLVTKFPGRTSKQLADLGPLDRYQIARRTADLRRLGLIYRFDPDEGDCQWYAEKERTNETK